jgi:SnoaL-like domain
MTNLVGEVPERGFRFLAGKVRRHKQFARSEVEGALQNYQEIARRATATRDWNEWADQFTEDAIYVEHQYGIMRGREAIRSWIVPTMAAASGQEFPMLWHLVDNDLVFAYCPIRYAAPDGGEPFQFICGMVMCYAGENMWCYEEDVYNALEAGRMADLYRSSLDTP